jgi:hypothetical protein
VTYIRFAWLAWLLAAMLFFSGTHGTGGLVVLCVLTGFGLTTAGIGQMLFKRRG